MDFPTFKEHIIILEIRQPGVKYTEKQVKNVLDKVTATLKGTDAANMTKLAKRYARLEVSMKAMKEKHEELNSRLKGDVQNLFDVEDVVLTRVVETAQFTLTMVKEVQKSEGSTEIDYNSIIIALSALIPDELQSRIDTITEKYTKIIPPKPPVKRLSVSKEVVSEGFMDTLKNKAAAFLKSIMSWATRYDTKLEALKRKAGILKENTIAHYDEKSRQRNAKILTAVKLVKKLNDSSLPQDVVNKVAKTASSFTGEITDLDLKDILRLAKLSASDKEEIIDLVSE